VIWATSARRDESPLLGLHPEDAALEDLDAVLAEPLQDLSGMDRAWSDLDLQYHYCELSCGALDKIPLNKN
jgi:hypothetical protein